MPLKLIPPGKRGNAGYLVRGTVAGRRVEVSAKTRDQAAARRFARELERAILENQVPAASEAVSFARAAALYTAWREPAKADLKRLDRLKLAIGNKLVGDLRQADLVDAANRLYPGCGPATRNREALRPAAAVLHYSAEQGYCGWLRIKLFKEPRPRTRAVSQDIARALVSSIPEMPAYKTKRTEKFLAAAALRQRRKRLLLLWLFRQGPRISDALRIRGENVDMKRRLVRYKIGKTDEWTEEALHEEVWELLANDPPGSGWLFPWRTKSGVYKWLRPFAAELGIKFTPHMARHSLGKWLNEDGASLRHIMDALHHADPKSSIRYQSTDIEVIRQAGQRLGKLL